MVWIFLILTSFIFPVPLHLGPLSKSNGNRHLYIVRYFKGSYVIDEQLIECFL